MIDGTFKTTIDTKLLELARLAGSPEGEVGATLEGLSAADVGPWSYLFRALSRTGGSLVDDRMRGAASQHWLLYFADGRDAEFVEPVFGSDDDDEGFDEDAPHLCLDDYPEESHACLRQGHFVGGYDADVLALWKRGDTVSLCHAHPEGFRVLGERPAEVVDSFVQAVTAPS